MTAPIFDVLIAGGGPAGSSLSLRLARAGCSVAMLERTTYDDFRVGESLPPAAATRLVGLRLWDPFLETKPAAVHGVQSAWGSVILESSSFLAHPLLNGWHLDRARFDRMLCAAASEAGAHIFQGMSAVSVQRSYDGSWTVCSRSARDEMSFRARFLVDAGGRYSRLGTQLGAHRIRADRMIGIASMYSHASGDDVLPSLVEAVPQGWWYSAGLPSGDTIAIFFTDSDICARHRFTIPANWRQLLSESHYTSQRLENRLTSSRLRVFPAGTQRLDRAAGTCWVAIGDALMGRDPLSSSGIDFAFASADRAFDLLVAMANGAKDGDEAFNADMRSDFDSYLSQRNTHYAAEQRWPTSPFWRRRHESAAISSDIGRQVFSVLPARMEHPMTVIDGS